MNNKNKYVEVKIKGSEDVYKFRYLNVLETREVVLKVSSLLAPAFGTGMDMFKELSSHEALAKSYIEEGLEPPESDISAFPLASVIGLQLENPAISAIADTLMKDALKNDSPYDLSQEYGEDAFNIYTKVLTASFKVNVLGPLVKCLNEAGYSEIVGFAQTVLSQKLPTN